MPTTNRKRLLYGLLLAAVVLMVLDFVALGPYFDARRELIEQHSNKMNSIEEARLLLKHEKELRQLVSGMSDSLAADPSTAEGQLLHLTHDWEQQAGVSGASFQRSHSGDEHGFTRLMFQISGSANIVALGEFLYRIETAGMPLRIDGMQIRVKGEGGGESDEIQFSVNISTPCQGKPAVAARVENVEGHG